VLDVYLDTLDSPHTRRAHERHIVVALDALAIGSVQRPYQVNESCAASYFESVGLSPRASRLPCCQAWQSSAAGS
jgi:hypothetical protein